MPCINVPVNDCIIMRSIAAGTTSERSSKLHPACKRRRAEIPARAVQQTEKAHRESE